MYDRIRWIVCSVEYSCDYVTIYYTEIRVLFPRWTIHWHGTPRILYNCLTISRVSLRSGWILLYSRWKYSLEYGGCGFGEAGVAVAGVVLSNPSSIITLIQWIPFQFIPLPFLNCSAIIPIPKKCNTTHVVAPFRSHQNHPLRHHTRIWLKGLI